MRTQASGAAHQSRHSILLCPDGGQRTCSNATHSQARRDAGAAIPLVYDMKNGIAIVAGVLMILAAFFIAAGTSSQDTSPRPQLAQALATTFYTTPSATRRATLTPIPAATPLRITQLDPSDQEILDLLFQYPYWGAYIIPSPAKLSLQRLVLDTPTSILIIAGNGATATDGHESYPAAFGAVFAWGSEGYARKFLRVQFGVKGAQVSVSISPNGRIVFGFREIGDGPGEGGVVSQQTIVLNSCTVAPHLAMVWGLDRRWQTATEFECF